jgi:hypothetical protein
MIARLLRKLADWLDEPRGGTDCVDAVRPIRVVLSPAGSMVRAIVFDGLTDSGGRMIPGLERLELHFSYDGTCGGRISRYVAGSHRTVVEPVRIDQLVQLSPSDWAECRMNVVAAGRLAGPQVQSLIALPEAVRKDVESKIRGQQALVHPGADPGPFGAPIVPYHPETTWADFMAQVRDRAAVRET